MEKKIILTLLILLTCFYSNSQDVSLLKVLNTQNGLSNGRVTSIAQDSIGFIWLGTKNGLNRYDGSSVKIYNNSNSNLKSNDISAIKLDSKNRLWIGTIGKGIVLYNAQKDKFISLNINVNINKIYEDSSNKIWIGTNKGLMIYNEVDKSFNPVRKFQKLNISAIIEIDIYSFLIGTNGKGLYLFNSQTQTLVPYLKENLLNPTFINVLHKYNSGEILIGTNGNGILSFSKEKNTLTNFLKDKIKASIIRSIYTDEDNNLWIGTDGKGVYKVLEKNNKQKVEIEHYYKDNNLQLKLVNNTVNSIYEDNQKNIWIATAWKGVNIIQKRQDNSDFFFSDFFGIKPSPVLSIFKDKKDILVGTDGEGLTEIEFSQKISTNKYLENDYIQKIKKTKNGNYWVGTFSNGLFYLNNNKGIIKKYQRSSNIRNSLPYNDVRDIDITGSGDLWIATWGGGLSYLNTQTESFTNFNYNSTNNSISSDNVLAIERDNGNLWIATWGGGLNFFNVSSKEFIDYNLEDQLGNSGSNYIYSLKKDKKENLWLGTKKGLVKFDIKKNKFEKITIGFSDNSNTVVAVLISNEKIWLSTKEGIYSYNPTTRNITSFKDFKGEYHINSAYKDEEDMLYFGGNEGFIRFSPEKVNSSVDIPKIVFTDFKLFNKSINSNTEGILNKHIPFEKTITLNHNQNVFTFNFSTLVFPFATGTQFSIMMKGFEKDWRFIGSEQSATYTNLSPGSYNFFVKTKTVDTNWSKPIGIKLIIKPPFWLTWWAYVIYFFFLVLAVLLVRKYTINWININNKLEFEKHKREDQDKLHQIKQRFFANISHEIRTPLTLIMSSLNVLQREDTNSVEKKSIAVVKNNTRRLLNLVNELLNFRKLETGNLDLTVQKTDIVSFTKEIFLAFSQEALINNLKYKFVGKEKPIQLWIDRIQLEKAIFNVLSNAFKFTQNGGKISVSIEKNESNIQILISDNGTGISKDKLPHIFERFYHSKYRGSQKGFGIGLSIVKDIIELHKGKITVTSKVGEGSIFSLLLPLGKDHFSGNQIKEDIIEEEHIENYKKGKVNINFKEFKGKVILLVEDNKHLREYLRDLLYENYLIIEAENGEEGLQKALHNTPDLIISDVMMPKLDGFSLCYKVKTDVRISHIPIILLTARSFSIDKIEGLKNGADDYLIKPFNEEVLKARIYNLLRNRQLIHERFSKDTILTPKDLVLSSPDESFLKKLVELLENNIENSNFNVEELSLEIGMSHSSLYKKIKALTGMTIVGFIRDFRLQRAAQLLINNNLSIIDVCFMVGYTDRKHFSQEFKKKFKVSPSVYIKENQ
ncbi:response regulator [Polaribacter batillariae]|uniref:histidine kinase n=1 Tax=Polaribacter batillariae TaxID=2808900 RepID=A0ABX7SXJ2_9FLAO|nr:hybrid sensor histidine kinase/response regulator transcription factor [Polaribacter batillariae]QTD38972.1 response regulator [Polaribacter batillariae]